MRARGDLTDLTDLTVRKLEITRRTLSCDDAVKMPIHRVMFPDFQRSMIPFSYRIQHTQIEKMIREELTKQLAIQVLQGWFRSCCIGGFGFAACNILESLSI